MVKKMKSKRHLPNDIISTNILIHLPVKTLCRFRCVCKPWYSLISHPSFQEHHHQLGLQKNHPHLVVTKFRFDRTTAASTIHLSTYAPTTDGTFLTVSPANLLRLPLSRFNPVQSCRGLICLGATTNRQILILNPSTHELFTLPPFQELSIQETAYFGFGYAPSTKEFKVVRFFRSYPDGNEAPQNCCEVFTMGGVSGWREAKGPPHALAPYYPPYLRGALHLMPDHDTFHSVTEHDSIAVFDLESEDYVTPIALPKHYHDVAMVNGGAACVRLTELGGTLCFTEQFLCGQGNMTFWLLKDSDKGEWAGQFVIDLSSLNPGVVNASPLACMGDGSFLLDVRMGEGKDYHSELLIYDAKERKISQTIDYNCWGTLYVESLFPLQKR